MGAACKELYRVKSRSLKIECAVMFFWVSTIMAHYKELPEYAANHGFWRAAANENMEYTDDFPASLLTLLELYDGSRSHGRASMIKTIIRLPPADSPVGTLGILIVEDNGVGIINDEALARLLTFASAISTTIHHRYGHGTKKMLAKWMPNYEVAKWKLEYRAQSRRVGHTTDLVEITAPFLGLKTPKKYTADNENLNPCGLRWTIDFDPKVLGDYTDPERLFDALKEIIRTRFSRIPLAATTFEVEVYEGDKLKKKENSRNWKTLEEVLDEEVKAGRARISRGPKTGAFESGSSWTAKEYLILDDKVLSKEFPTYGCRNMRSSRVHMSLDGRFIEARPIHKMIGALNNHNEYNGRIGIVNFILNETKDYDKLPTPATTKVAFSETCPIFLKFKDECSRFLLGPELSIVETQELRREDIRKMRVNDLKEWCAKKKIANFKTLKKEDLIKALDDTFITPEERVANAAAAEKALEERKKVAEKTAKEKAEKEKLRIAAAEEAAKKATATAALKKVADEKAAEEARVKAAKRAEMAAEEAAKKAAEEKATTEAAAALVAEEAKGVAISLDGVHVKKYKTFPEGKTMDDLLTVLNTFFG